MPSDLFTLCITPDSSIHDAIVCIDRNAEGIALVVDADRRLLGTVTDGDIRRAILAGLRLDGSVQKLLDQRHAGPGPITAPIGTPDAELLHLMNEHVLRHIPLIDSAGRVAGIALLSELAKDYEQPLAAVIMAGGFGMRLRPLTDEIPKPMLPVGDKPLLELLVRQLHEAGIRRVNMATHYKGDVIAKHFGDGRKFGVEIRYMEENEPLGTAGALGLVEASDTPLLVINGDIMTRIDFRAMTHFHREHRANMTMAVKEYDIQVPYGVVSSKGTEVTGISEKPVIRHFINAGIYLLNPELCKRIPHGRPYDMPDFVAQLLADGQRVISFPIREYWMDLGRLADYEQTLKQMN